MFLLLQNISAHPDAVCEYIRYEEKGKLLENYRKKLPETPVYNKSEQPLMIFEVELNPCLQVKKSFIVRSVDFGGGIIKTHYKEDLKIALLCEPLI